MPEIDPPPAVPVPAAPLGVPARLRIVEGPMPDPFVADHLAPARWVYALAAAFVVALLVAWLAVFPARDVRVGVGMPFLVTYACIVAIFDLLTGLLLLGQFLIGHRRSGLILHLSYMFAALMVVPYAACFPGVVAADGAFGSAHSTSLWLWTFWHGGVALLAILYVVALRLEGPAPRAVPPGAVRREILAAAAFLVLIVGFLVYIALTQTAHLPDVIRGTDYRAYRPIGYAVTALQFLAVTGLVASTKVRTVAHLWYGVTLLAGLCDVSISISSSIRWTVSWYAARCFTVCESVTLTLVLGASVVSMYIRIRDHYAVADLVGGGE